MHRRQYYAGSGRNGAPTVSRRQVARHNRELRAVVDAQRDALRAQHEQRRRDEAERERTSLRGFLERTKRFLAKPIRLNRRAK